VYVASYEIGPLFKVPLGGGPAIELDALSATTVAVDATRAYTVSPVGNGDSTGLVVACAKAGCGGNPTIIASGQGQVWGIAVDDANVYWSRLGAGGGVMKAPVTGGTPTVLASGMSASRIVAGKGFVLFEEDTGALKKVSAAGGTPETVVDAQFVGPIGALTADDESAYYEGSGVIGRVPFAGGPPSKLAVVGSDVRAIAVDCTNVYVAEYDSGSILAVPKEGGAITTFVTGQLPEAVAVDHANVYWVNSDGSIMKAAK
jgi:hypothetical protein